MRKCAIFDLDGTLIDSRADLVNAVNWVRTCFALPPLPFEQVVAYVGNGIRLLLTRALERSGVELEPALKIMAEYYDANCLANTKLYPGVADGLRRLHVAGIPMAVITNKPQFATEKILNGLGIAGYFSAVIGGDSIFPLKPDPASLLFFNEECGASPEISWMLGDHHTDLEAARRAGMRRCFADYGFGKRHDETYDFKAACFAEFVALCLGEVEIKALMTDEGQE